MSIGDAVGKLLDRWGVSSSQAAGRIDLHREIDAVLAEFSPSARTITLDGARLSVAVDHPLEIEELLGQDQTVLCAVNERCAATHAQHLTRLHVTLRRS